MEKRSLGGTATRLYAERIKDGIRHWIPDLLALFGTRYDYFEHDGVDGDDDAPAGDYFVAIQVDALRLDGRLGVGRRDAAG